jgi:plasmid stabilization system protein ParE
VICAIRVVPEAEAELEASARWYEEQTGSPVGLVHAIDAALAAIAEGPLRYPLWRPGSPYRKHAIRAVPYVIYYRVLRDYVEATRTIVHRERVEEDSWESRFVAHSPRARAVRAWKRSDAMRTSSPWPPWTSR